MVSSEGQSEGSGSKDRLDLTEEYWERRPPAPEHTERVREFLKNIDARYLSLTTRERRAIKRNALRTLRGNILRTELYALDGSPLQDKPYTVIEQAYGLKKSSLPT